MDSAHETMNDAQADRTETCVGGRAGKRRLLRNWLADRGASVIFPLVFVFPSTVNFLFFYLGLASEDNPVREYGFILANVALAVFCGLVFLSVLSERHTAGLQLAASGAGVLFAAACFAFSILQNGMTSAFAKFFPQFVVFGIPAFFSGYSGARKQKESGFFPLLETISFLAAPAMVYYLLMSFLGKLPPEWANGLGIMNYMDVAYGFMPFLLAHLIQFVENGEWIVPFSKKALRHPQWIRAVLCVLYWLAIIATGTRGAYFCVIGTCLLLAVRIGKHKGKALLRFALPLCLIGILLMSLYVYALPGLGRVHRMDVFVEGVAEGEINTSNTNTVSDEMAEQMVDNDVSVSELREQGARLTNRGTLYKLAWREFRQAPWTGMGPLGFFNKYGTYPHNAILELLCETGLFGICFLILLLAALIRLLKLSGDQDAVWPILIFLLAYAIQANISGCVWDCGALQWALGYGLTAQRLQNAWRGRQRTV